MSRRLVPVQQTVQQIILVIQHRTYTMAEPRPVPTRQQVLVRHAPHWAAGYITSLRRVLHQQVAIVRQRRVIIWRQVPIPPKQHARQINTVLRKLYIIRTEIHQQIVQRSIRRHCTNRLHIQKTSIIRHV